MPITACFCLLVNLQSWNNTMASFDNNDLLMRRRRIGNKCFRDKANFMRSLCHLLNSEFHLISFTWFRKSPQKVWNDLINGWIWIKINHHNQYQNIYLVGHWDDYGLWVEANCSDSERTFDWSRWGRVTRVRSILFFSNPCSRHKYIIKPT